MRKLFLLPIVVVVLVVGGATLSVPAVHASAVPASTRAAHPPCRAGLSSNGQ